MKRLLAILCVLCASFAASASDVKYSYFDLNYQFGGKIDVTGVGSVDNRGYRVTGSFAIDSAWFGEFDYYGLDTSPSGIKTTDYRFLGGWHNEMFFAKLGYEHQTTDVTGLGSVDGSGYNMDVGVRSMVTDAVELNAHLGHADLGSSYGSFDLYGFGAVWMASGNMGVSFNYDHASASGVDYTSYGVGLRYNFD